jgi:subtilisin family serine protease
VDPALWEELREVAGGELEAIIRLRPGVTDVPGVRVVARFGSVATCRLPARDVRRVREHPAVRSLKAARALSPDLVDVSAVPGDAVLPGDVRYRPGRPYTGAGVVVGVVDWGLDVPRFPRVLGLWDQRGSGPHAPAPYGYGRVLDRRLLEAARRSRFPYDVLRYHPWDADRGGGAHGTHVADIAVGDGSGGGPPGVAPEAWLVFVHLADRGTSGLATLGDSVRLLEAVDFVRRTAGPLPWVVNVSVGRHGGPHDGRTLVELAFDELLAAAPGRFIVQSAGNYYRSRTHATGMVSPGGRRRLTFATHPDDRSPNELEIWYPGTGELAVRVTPPGRRVGRWVGLGRRSVLAGNGRSVGRLYHRARDPNNGDHHVDAFLSAGAPAGTWTVDLASRHTTAVRFHAWLERDDGCPPCQARFTGSSVDATSTIGTIANGRLPLVVGAYDAHHPAAPAARFSSSGPTRDHRAKPDLLAPGVDVLAARSALPGSRTSPALLVRKSGTSMAAPHVTGAVALCLQATGGRLPAGEIRRLLLSTARPSRSVSAERGGAGYLDLDRLLDAVRAHPLTEPIRTPSEEFAVSQIDPSALLPVPPARAFRELLYRPEGRLARWVDQRFVVVGRPCESVPRSAGQGDLLLDVALGRRGPGTCTMVDDPQRIPARLGPGQLLLHPRADRDAPGPSEEQTPSASGLWVAGAERLDHPRSTGLPHVAGAPWRFVFHTIEARPSASAFRSLAARHRTPPHLWAMPSQDLLFQVIPLDRAAYALAHPAGTPHTNRMRAVQVECWGFARDMQQASSDLLEWLATRVLAPVARLVPIDLGNVRLTGGPECYGRRAACRMSDDEWQAFTGVCGHQHVPHNSHWDPGRLDLPAIAARAAAVLRGAAPAAGPGAGDAGAEPEDDAEVHGGILDGYDDAADGDGDLEESSRRSGNARLEWTDLTQIRGGDGRDHLYYLVSGPSGGGPSKMKLKVTNTNRVHNHRNPSLKVRLRARVGPDQYTVVPLEGQGSQPWKSISDVRELEDESSRVVELHLDGATRWRAYDADQPLRRLDVEYHWYEGGLGSYSAHYASTSLGFYLVGPVELLLRRKRLVEERALDDASAHAEYWRPLWANSDPRPVQYSLSMQASMSDARTGQVSVTSNTTLTQGTERSEQVTNTSELSVGFGIEKMFTLGQKLGTSVTSGVRWNESVARSFTTMASRSRTFTQGHTETFQVSGQIPAAPRGRRQSLYAYPIVGVYEVPVVLYGRPNALGQATQRRTDRVPVVWLRGWGTRVVLS